MGCEDTIMPPKFSFLMEGVPEISITEEKRQVFVEFDETLKVVGFTVRSCIKIEYRSSPEHEHSILFRYIMVSGETLNDAVGKYMTEREKEIDLLTGNAKNLKELASRLSEDFDEVMILQRG